MVHDLGAEELGKVLDLPNLGQPEGILKDYDFEHEKFVAAAERTQRRTKKFNAKGLEGLGNMFTDVMENPGANVRDDLIYFNIPVCDLETWILVAGMKLVGTSQRGVVVWWRLLASGALG